ncbi:MAG: polyprenyl diphosphate synthase [Candidatus Pelagibacterales bacterium]
MTSQAYKKSSIKTIKLNHLAIIMDGNRRWAKKHKLKSNLGHKEGIKNAINILKKINNESSIKLKYITLYVFAVNNWKRSSIEINTLFNLIKETYNKFEHLSAKQNFKIKHFGSNKRLPKSIKEIINDLQESTKNNTGVQINLAFNYSAREEIIEAINQLIINKKSLNKFESYLYSHGIPDPDLIIRTGGELRMSDFLLWQSAYSELIFSNKLWPEFKFSHLKMSLFSYLKRKRNYGK